MAKQQGMLNITPELEEKGRFGDTEVGYVESGSIVVPRDIANNPELSEMFDSIKNAIKFQQQEPNSFEITAPDTTYAYNKENAIPAHLTNGEFVIPAGVVNISPDVQTLMPIVFEQSGYDFSNYLVGDPNNRINPQTGLPEYWGIKIGPIGIGSDYGGISVGNTSLSDVGKAIKRGLDSVVDFGTNFVKSLGQGVEDLFKGDIDAVLSNPAVIATASFMFPQYGAYISLGSKAATGQKITTSDLVSAGFSASTDFAKVKIDPNIQKAVTTAAQVSEGTDPVQALASNYGANWLDETGIGDSIKSGVRSTIGQEYGDRVFDTIDLNQAVADYAGGKSTERILANQFGDELVGAINSTNPSVNAAGYAGLESAVLKAEGASDQDALLGGAETYYNRGGQLPDINQVASLAGIQDFDFDPNALIPRLNLDLPTVSNLGFDLPSLSQYGFDLNQFNLTVPDLLSPDLTLPEIADLGVDFKKIDFEGYSPRDLGYDVGELADIGVDLGQLNLDLETLGLGLALGEGQQGKEFTPEGDEIVSLENEFLVPQIETPFSQQVLGNLKIV